jgi:hypothetical protein
MVIILLNHFQSNPLCTLELYIKWYNDKSEYFLLIFKKNTSVKCDTFVVMVIILLTMSSIIQFAGLYNSYQL